MRRLRDGLLFGVLTLGMAAASALLAVAWRELVGERAEIRAKFGAAWGQRVEMTEDIRRVERKLDALSERIDRCNSPSPPR